MSALDTDASTIDPFPLAVVTPVFAAIEALTDDHVRRHAADPWAELWADTYPAPAMTDEDRRGRIERAVAHLTEALAAADDELGHLIIWDQQQKAWTWECARCHAQVVASTGLTSVRALRDDHLLSHASSTVVPA